MLAGGSKAHNPVRTEPQEEGSKVPIRVKQEPGSTTATDDNNNNSSSSGSSSSTRVYFQYVCSDVDGYPNVDYRNEHVGHFDFDERGLAAKGVLHYPWWSEKAAPLSLFKILETPDRGKEPMPWCEYDGRRWGSF